MRNSLREVLQDRKMNDAGCVFLSLPEYEETITYGTFIDRTEELLSYLREQGVRERQRVGILLNNGVEWLETFSALIMGNCVAVPLNPQLKDVEIQSLVRQADVKFLIGYESRIRQMWRGQAKAYEGNCYAEPLCIVSCAEEGEGNVGVDEALLLFTSGSTGKPKGVVLTHKNLLAEVGYIVEGHKLTKADTVLCVLPFFHINGLVITFLTTLFLGAHAVVPQGMGSVSSFWQMVRKYKATWFSGVPVLISMLAMETAPWKEYAKSLRFARSASSALPVAVLQKFEEGYGVPVIESYGISEAGSQVATNPLPPEQRKQGSVGKPAGNRMMIVDEKGDSVPNGTEGEVIVSGDNISAGYLDNPEANLESFRNGWFYTGDLGKFDEDGYLFLTGRKKELINRAGEKISPREIDEVLYQIPGVAIAAAVGVPDPLLGEEVVAYIQTVEGVVLTEKEIQEYCATKLADFKLPKKIFFLTDFPKGANGKIQRRRLTELYMQN